jgi:hypothetical protein
MQSIKRNRKEKKEIRNGVVTGGPNPRISNQRKDRIRDPRFSRYSDPTLVPAIRYIDMHDIAIDLALGQSA